MFDDYALDLSWSAKLFIDQVWPICKGFCGGGELVSVEGHADNELARLLDIKAGIDGWQSHTDGMRGIASRIQVVDNPYNSFTIRLSRDTGTTTEYDKRKIAIESGKWIFPHISIQAYAQTKIGPVLSCGVAKTEDIVDFINRGFHKTNRTSNAAFAVCYWTHLIFRGYEVKVWPEIKSAPLQKGVN